MEKHLWADIYEIIIDADQTDEIIQLVNEHLKEFAEKLKTSIPQNTHSTIDELLKEFLV